MTNYEVAGNRIKEQDSPLVAASRERGSQAHHDSLQGATTPAIWYVTDQSASMKDVFDTSEQVVETVSYDSFGNLLSEPNAADDSAFRRYDCDPNVLYLSCTRAYDPRVGRWLSDEPTGFAAGADNLVSYVGNDPTEASE